MLIPSEMDNIISIQRVKKGDKIYLTIHTSENFDITAVSWTLNKKAPKKIIIGDNSAFIVLIYSYTYYASLNLIKNFSTSSFKGGELLSYLAGPNTMFGTVIKPSKPQAPKMEVPLFTILGTLGIFVTGALIAYNNIDDE
jgi:hypothetical protein